MEDLQNKLHQAETYARKMQMINQRKNPKNPMNEEFAVLIAELESIRARLSILDHERSQALEQNAKLRSKLEHNQRDFDKERQFLPLLHKVRGPVGPQNPMLRR